LKPRKVIIFSIYDLNMREIIEENIPVLQSGQMIADE